MSDFDVIAILITMAALFAWVNHRYIGLPTTIGVMITSLVFSLGLVLLGRFGVERTAGFLAFMAGINFDEAVFQGMLGALLFAGALHLELENLLRQKAAIAALATLGTAISIMLVGGLTRVVFDAVGITLPLVYCLLFGAIVSPTDPIAVSAILKQAHVPESLFTKITGESLFNDGVGVVLFLLLLGLATSGEPHALAAVESHALAAVKLFVVEVLGGLVFGAVIGAIAYQMLRRVDQYTVEMLVTLAVVTGGYALANHLHVSGPLAMVVAGLLIGNHGRALAMSDTTRTRLDSFWELVDELLNAVLFVLIGIEVVAVELSREMLFAGMLAIPIVLLARWISVGAPMTALRLVREYTPHAVAILTWSGLKGGISVALALALPAGPYRDLIVTATYMVVCFSIIVQGLTVNRVVRRLIGQRA